jgi:averantin hydroxylase
MRGTLVQDVYAIHKKYGPMVRVAPNELSFATPDAIKPIYQSHPEFPKDPETLARDSFAVPNIISAPYEDHRRYRRLLSSAFSDRSINDKQDRLLTYVDSLISQLSKTAERGESVDLQTWFNWTTFDIIGDLAFGQPFGCLRDAKTHQWIIDLQVGIRGIAVLNALRRLRLGWLGKMLVAKKLIDGRRRTMRYSLEKIDERLQYGAEPRGDFWDAVLGAKGADLKESAEKGIDVTGAAMTREEMVSNAQALVIAGSETSATVMAGCIWLLLRPKNRECLRKLADEIRSSFRSTEEIVLANVNGLEYLRAVLDESLRVYPPAPLPNNRVVTAKGALISGHFVPPGVSVFHSSPGPVLLMCLGMLDDR